MPARELVIYGAAFPDVVKIVGSINARNPSFTIAGFVDDEKAGIDDTYFGYPILGGEEVVPVHRDRGCLFVNNVFGSLDRRRLIAEKLDSHGVAYATLVAPDVDLTLVRIGQGSLISDRASFGAGVVIGNHVGVRMNACINHECVLGDYVFVGPSAVLCGRVRIGEGAYIGAGAVIKDRLTVHAGARIGMGAIVNADVAAGDVVASLPARSVKGLLP
jgi:sugar O-acyltransferase (sialic acid O-acetyltransferase NeuD family)